MTDETNENIKKNFIELKSKEVELSSMKI